MSRVRTNVKLLQVLWQSRDSWQCFHFRDGQQAPTGEEGVSLSEGIVHLFRHILAWTRVQTWSPSWRGVFKNGRRHIIIIVDAESCIAATFWGHAYWKVPMNLCEKTCPDLLSQLSMREAMLWRNDKSIHRFVRLWNNRLLLPCFRGIVSWLEQAVTSFGARGPTLHTRWNRIGCFWKMTKTSWWLVALI